MRFLRPVLWGLLVLALVAVVGTGAFVWTSGRPTPEAVAALGSDTQVQVTTDGWLIFRPTATAPTRGFIFYPGGLVHPAAYAPPAHALAAQGYLVVIVPMPLNLAVLAPNRAAEVKAAFPEVHAWAIGGHSLGGAMAASYVAKHPGDMQGLVFWAAYPAGSDNLAGATLPVTSISGTLDGLATPDKIAASRALLPPTTRFVPIEGSNHAQFGSYGAQRGDNAATISREAQQQQAVAATAELLTRLGK